MFWFDFDDCYKCSLVFFKEGVPISFDWILMNGKTGNYPNLMGIFSFQFFFLVYGWFALTTIIWWRIGCSLECPLYVHVNVVLGYDSYCMIVWLHWWWKAMDALGLSSRSVFAPSISRQTWLVFFFHLNLLKPEYVTK